MLEQELQEAYDSASERHSYNNLVVNTLTGFPGELYMTIVALLFQIYQVNWYSIPGNNMILLNMYDTRHYGV